MRDLKSTLTRCFECIGADFWGPTSTLRYTDKSSYMVIPISSENIEIPVMALSMSTMENQIRAKGDLDAIVVNLNNIGGYTMYKSASAAIRNVFSTVYCNVHLRKIMSVGDTEKKYYGTYGAIFDENFKPIVMLSWEMKRVHQDGENNPIKFKFIRPILRVAPEVLINKSNVIERFIINQIIPTSLTLNYISSPSCYKTTIYEGNDRDEKVKVIIEDSPFIVREADVPSVSTTNEELLDIASNYIDEVVE